MKVTIKLKNRDMQEITNVWEIQSNDLQGKRTLQLVGYDHIVSFRAHVTDIESLQIVFEEKQK